MACGLGGRRDVARRPASSSGVRSLKAIGKGSATAISGKLTQLLLPTNTTKPLVEKPGLQRMSNGSTTSAKRRGFAVPSGSGQARKVGTSHPRGVPFCPKQRLARFVRKTLAFPKSDHMHLICLRLFLHRYNLERALAISPWSATTYIL